MGVHYSSNDLLARKINQMTNQSNSVFKSQQLLIIAAIVLKGHKNFIRAT